MYLHVHAVPIPGTLCAVLDLHVDSNAGNDGLT